VTVPEEGCPRRDQLNDSAQLPDFHLRVIGVLKLEEDNVAQLQVLAGGHLLGGFSTNWTFLVSCDEGAGLRLIHWHHHQHNLSRGGFHARMVQEAVVDGCDTSRKDG